MIPAAIDQNINTVSTGSFTAVLNLTIDNAPTIPNESAKFELIVLITNEVTIASKMIDKTNDLVYETPV